MSLCSRTTKITLVSHYDWGCNLCLQEISYQTSSKPPSDVRIFTTYDKASRLEESYELQAKNAVVDESSNDKFVLSLNQ